MSPAQLGLFDTRTGPRTRKHDPQSSRDAARKVDAQKQRNLILRELRGALNGLTCDELETLTHIKREHVASRLAQMRADGLVEPFGKRRNCNNINVQVWYVTAVANVRTELV